MNECRYAWFNAPTDGMPEETCGVEHYNIRVVPGMGQWCLVALKRSMRQDELPNNMLLANLVAKALSDGAVSTSKQETSTHAKSTRA